MTFNDFWKKQYRFEKKLSAPELEGVRRDIQKWEDQGIIANKIIERLSKKYSEIGEEWQARRAYMTESKRMQTTQIKDEAEDLEMEKFVIQPAPDACPICKKFTENGNKVFTRGMMKHQGRAVPPIHPNCYCIVIPL